MLLIMVCWRKEAQLVVRVLLFQHLDEVQDHQAEHGGRINKITQMKMNEEGDEREGQTCYILNLKRQG